MNTRTKNLINRHFSRLKVIGYAYSKNGQTYWDCKCTCGKLTIIRRSHLIDGTTKSCGCYGRKKASLRLRKYASGPKHKGSNNPTWKGNKAGLTSIHVWLSRHYRKGKCEECSSTKNLDWALIKGKKHSHNRKHYKVLCRSHHLKYDYTNERRTRIGKLLTSARLAKKVKKA